VLDRFQMLRVGQRSAVGLRWQTRWHGHFQHMAQSTCSPRRRDFKPGQLPRAERRLRPLDAAHTLHFTCEALGRKFYFVRTSAVLSRRLRPSAMGGATHPAVGVPAIVNTPAWPTSTAQYYGQFWQTGSSAVDLEDTRPAPTQRPGRSESGCSSTGRPKTTITLRTRAAAFGLLNEVMGSREIEISCAGRRLEPVAVSGCPGQIRNLGVLQSWRRLTVRDNASCELSAWSGSEYHSVATTRSARLHQRAISNREDTVAMPEA